MSATEQRVREVVRGVLDSPPADTSTLGRVELYDVEFAGGTLRVVLDRAGGLDVGTISALTRSISTALDEADPIQSSYTLEVTSPGLERRLRSADHFGGAVGERVSFKLRPGVEGDRRFVGEVAEVAGDHITVTGIEPHGGERVVQLADITRAQVHVDWTPPPKPGRPGAPSRGTRAGGSQRDDDSGRTNHSEAT